MGRVAAGGVLDAIDGLRRAVKALDESRVKTDAALGRDAVRDAMRAEGVEAQNVIGAARDLLASLDASGL